MSGAMRAARRRSKFAEGSRTQGAHLCPLMSGESLVKCLKRVLVDSRDERSGESVDQAGVSFLREARARTTSVGEPPIASTALSRRSMLTEGSPDSIFATRD